MSWNVVIIKVFMSCHWTCSSSHFWPKLAFGSCSFCSNVAHQVPEVLVVRPRTCQALRQKKTANTCESDWGEPTASQWADATVAEADGEKRVAALLLAPEHTTSMCGAVTAHLRLHYLVMMMELGWAGNWSPYVQDKWQTENNQAGCHDTARHVTCDMWHVTCDMRHVTCDMWHSQTDGAQVMEFESPDASPLQALYFCGAVQPDVLTCIYKMYHIYIYIFIYIYTYI